MRCSFTLLSFLLKASRELFKFFYENPTNLQGLKALLGPHYKGQAMGQSPLFLAGVFRYAQVGFSWFWGRVGLLSETQNCLLNLVFEGQPVCLTSQGRSIVIELQKAAGKSDTNNSKWKYGVVIDYTTVDGTNPAPHGMYKTLLIMG